MKLGRYSLNVHGRSGSMQKVDNGQNGISLDV